MSAELNAAIQRRSVVRGRATRLLRGIDLLDTPIGIQLRTNDLQTVQKDLEDLNERILILLAESPDADAEISRDTNDTDSRYSTPIENAIAALRTKQVQIDRQMHQQAASAAATSNAPWNHLDWPKLSDVKMGKYDGNPIGFSEWWDLYEAQVHSNPRVPGKIVKLGWLLEHLEGNAKRAVQAYPKTEAGYDLVIAELKKFGKDHLRVDALCGKLWRLPRPSNCTSELRAYLDETNSIFRSLESLKIDITHPSYRSIFTQNLPVEVVAHLFREIDDDKWGIEEIRKEFESFVVSKQDAEVTSGQAKNADSKVNTRAGITLVTRVNKSGSEPSNGCYFCGAGHYADSCKTYETIESRKERLKQTNCCYRCLRKGHVASKCKTKVKPCYCCGSKRHISALCGSRLENFYKQKSGAVGSQVKTEKMCDRGRRYRSGDSILSTAVTRIRDSVSKRESTGRILSDNCSTNNYITAKLAQRLGCVEPIVKQRLDVFPFGKNEPDVIYTYAATIELRSKNGHYRSVDVFVVPSITGPIERFPMSKNLEYKLRCYQMADPLPLEQECVDVDMLLGHVDSSWFVYPHRRIVQNNLWIVNSEFGWILTGQLSSHDMNLDRDTEIGRFSSNRSLGVL